MTQPYRSVVVGTDGSPTARRALDASISVAIALDVPLTIATAFERGMFDRPSASVQSHFPGGFAMGQEAGWAREVATDAAAIARQAGVADVRQTTPVGAAAEALIELASRSADDLIVVGTRGLSETAERVVGNIPHELTHHAHNDLLMIHREGPVWQSVCLATDGSGTANLACARGLAFARAVGATATLVTIAKDAAVGEATLVAAAAALGAPDLARRVVAGHGHVGDELAEAATEFDLLTLGNRGMSGIARILGSVPNTVTHQIPTDLLLVNTSR